jgi:hypothetical protein
MIEVTLQFPIKAHGEEVSVLKFKRPTMADMIKMDQADGELGKLAKLIESTAQIPASSVAQIDVSDIGRIAEALSPFFSVSLPTGKNAPSA